MTSFFSLMVICLSCCLVDPFSLNAAVVLLENSTSLVYVRAYLLAGFLSCPCFLCVLRRHQTQLWRLIVRGWLLRFFPLIVQPQDTNTDCSGSGGVGTKACAILEDSLKVVVTDTVSWNSGVCSGMASIWDTCFELGSLCWAQSLGKATQSSVCDRLSLNIAQTHYTLNNDIMQRSLSDVQVQRIPGTNAFLVKKPKAVPGKAVDLTVPLDFGNDCEALFKGVRPRTSGATSPLCAAAAASPTR